MTFQDKPFGFSLLLSGERISCYFSLEKMVGLSKMMLGLAVLPDFQNHWFLEETNLGETGCALLPSIRRGTDWFSLVCLENTNTTASVSRRS
jgi:hypothetical protein